MKRMVALLAVLAVVAWGLVLAVEFRSQANDDDQRREQIAHPADDVVAMADRLRLTAEGRELFFRSVPRFVGAASVMQTCADDSDRPGDSWDGCFDGSTITIYRPSDPRLAGSMVTTAAHELLHAAYARLDKADRAEIDGLVAREVERLPVKAPVRQQIATSSRRGKQNLGTEEFAYLGTQVKLRGGFAPALEAIYARYFTDRGALITSYRRSQRTITRVWNEVVAEERAVVDLRAALERDKNAYTSDREQLQHEADLARTMTADELVQTRVSLTRGGRLVYSESLEEYLRTEGGRLQQIYDGFAGRDAALAARAQRAAVRRADAEALVADAQAGVAARSTSGG